MPAGKGFRASAHWREMITTERDHDHRLWSKKNRDQRRKRLDQLEAEAAHGDRNQTFVSAARDGDLETITTLLAEGIDVDARPPCTSSIGLPGDNCTALHKACIGNHQTIAIHLLSFGADVNAVDEDDHTPLTLFAHMDLRT